jgi:predicted transposase YbfD/YdcC
MAACDQVTGVILASTDVDGKTNEITRFAPLLDQISDLRDTVITADAMHCQRDHVWFLSHAVKYGRRRSANSASSAASPCGASVHSLLAIQLSSRGVPG